MGEYLEIDDVCGVISYKPYLPCLCLSRDIHICMFFIALVEHIFQGALFGSCNNKFWAFQMKDHNSSFGYLDFSLS